MTHIAYWDAPEAISIKFEAPKPLEARLLFQVTNEGNEMVIMRLCDYRSWMMVGMCLWWSFGGVWMLIWGLKVLFWKIPRFGFGFSMEFDEILAELWLILCTVMLLFFRPSMLFIYRGNSWIGRFVLVFNLDDGSWLCCIGNHYVQLHSSNGKVSWTLGHTIPLAAFETKSFHKVQDSSRLLGTWWL